MPGYLSELPETQPQFDFDEEDDDAENVRGDPLPKPTAYLVFGENGQEERRQAIYSGETVIGRDPKQCQILIDKFVNNDSTALTISRVHAKITSENMAHFIMPLSTNSNTTKNKVTLKKDVFYDLNDGSQLTFGTLQARFVLRVEGETPDRSGRKNGEAALDETVNDSDHEVEELADNGPNLSAILGRGNSFSVLHDQPVCSPTMADTSIVKETPPSADRDGSGLLLRIEENSPEADLQHQVDTDGIRTKLDYSGGKSLSETQDMFQSDSSAGEEMLNETPPPADSRACKSQPVDASPEVIVPRLRRLVNITPIRVGDLPSPAIAQVDQPTIEVESLPYPNTQQLVETQAYFANEPASTDQDEREISTADTKSKTTLEWTTATEFATLLQGHNELSTVTDILKSNSPRKKPEQEYDFECSQQLKDGLSPEKLNYNVASSIVTRAYQGKVDSDKKNPHAELSTKLTPPSLLQKNRFEYFDPKSSGRKSRNGRSPRIPAAVVKKTPTLEPNTSKSATSTGRKRKTVKEEPTETALEVTTPLRRSARKVQRIEYTAPPTDSEHSEADSDDRPLITFIPKRISSHSSGDPSKAKRTKTDTASDNLPTKKKSSKKVVDEPEPGSGADDSPNDDLPLIAHLRSGSEKKKKNARGKEQVSATPKGRQHSAVNESPKEETPVKLQPTRLRVVLKKVREDAPSSPLHTPIDRRRIRKLPGKFNEVPEEESPIHIQEIAPSTPLFPKPASELSAANDVSVTATTPRPQRTRSQTTPTSAVRTNSMKITSATRSSTRKRSGSDTVRILLSLACKQDEELLRIVELFGETESICDATHFVANQPRRTCKLVASAARGIPIVTSDWLLACKKKGKLVDTKEFALQGNIAGCDLPSSIANSRQRGRTLEGWCIALTEGAEPSTEELSEVVKAAGGTLVESLTHDCRLLVAKRDERAAAIVNDAFKRRIPIVEGRMLLQAILEHTTDFRNPRLALKF